MDAVMNLTNDSNMLALVKKGKCEGCNETALDTEVLHCHLCKNYFHAANCTVRDTLDRDALPAFTNLTNYIKFSGKNYPTGKFVWSCFRCGVINQLSSNEDIGQRVTLVEALLITLSPALSALTTSVDNGRAQDIANLVSDIRAFIPAALKDNPSSNSPASSEGAPSVTDVCPIQRT